MTAGVGMDLIEVARVERALDRHPRLADRLFTEAELRYSSERGRPGRHLAARFAAKEAVVKALGLGPGTRLREIEVVPGTDADPAPSIRLHGEALDEAESRGLGVKVSLTHAREMAGAVAIAEAV
ncbi:MAG: holo-ACP synthase [Solirubrobacterales bacterium]|nr:holo-ACP synthase [Solirubrobacterales bacterium]